MKIGRTNWLPDFEEIFSATHEGLGGDLETLFKSGGLGTASAGSSSGESVTSIKEVNK